MKKGLLLITMILTLLTALVLTACDGGKDNSQDGGKVNSSSVSSEWGDPNNPDNPEDPDLPSFCVTVNLKFEENGETAVDYYELTKPITIGEERLKFGENNYHAVTFYNRYKIKHDGKAVGDDFCIDRNLTLDVVVLAPEYTIKVTEKFNEGYSSNYEYEGYGSVTYYQFFAKKWPNNATDEYSKTALSYEWWRDQSQFDITMNGKPVNENTVISGKCTIVKQERPLVSKFEVEFSEYLSYPITLNLYDATPLKDFVETQFKNYCYLYNSETLEASKVLAEHKEYYEFYFNGKPFDVYGEELDSYVVDKDLKIEIKLKEEITFEFYVENKFDKTLYGPYVFVWNTVENGPKPEIHYDQIQNMFMEDIFSKYPDEEEYHYMYSGFLYVIKDGKYELAYENPYYQTGCTFIFNEYLSYKECMHANSEKISQLCSNKIQHYYCLDCSTYYYLNDFGNPIPCYACNTGGIKEYSFTFVLDGKESDIITLNLEGYNSIWGVSEFCLQLDYEYTIENYEVVVNGKKLNLPDEIELELTEKHYTVEFISKNENVDEDRSLKYFTIIDDGKARSFIYTSSYLHQFITEKYFTKEVGWSAVEAFIENHVFEIDGVDYSCAEAYITNGSVITVKEKPETPPAPEVTYTFRVTLVLDNGQTVEIKETKADSYCYIKDIMAKYITEYFAGYDVSTSEGAKSFFENYEIYLDGAPLVSFNKNMHSNRTYVMEIYKKIVIDLPEDNSVLSIAEFLKVVEKLQDGALSTDRKYIITGTITSVENDAYGNVYIQDENGDSIFIYGLYSKDGTVRYRDFDVKPVVGDVITVLGTPSYYRQTLQMNRGWVLKLLVGGHTETPVAPEKPEEPTLELPEPCMGLSIEEFIKIAEMLKVNGLTTENQYIISGTITSIENDVYGNVYIQDKNGISIFIYGLYDRDGAMKYCDLEVKPGVGDTITVLGTPSYYKERLQMDKGLIVDMTIIE